MQRLRQIFRRKESPAGRKRARHWGGPDLALCPLVKRTWLPVDLQMPPVHRPSPRSYCQNAFHRHELRSTGD